MKSLKIHLTEEQVYSIVGLAGVSKHEPRRAQRWGRLFMVLMVAAAMLLLLEWQWILLNEVTYHQRIVINWVVWLLFVTAFYTELLVVRNKRRYLAQNWFLPVVILLGIPFLFGVAEYIDIFDGLRPILALIILTPSISTLFKFLIDGHLRTTLLTAFVIVVIVGLLIAGIDSNIKTPWDGIWWALATVSTVGYGDVVPTSALGRLIGAGLIVMGLALFVIITANIFALILRKETHIVREEEKQVKQIAEQIEEVRRMQLELVKLTKTLAERLENSEKDT